MADETSGVNTSKFIEPDPGEGTSGTKVPPRLLRLSSFGSVISDWSEYDVEAGGQGISHQSPTEPEDNDICADALLKKLCDRTLMSAGTTNRGASIWRVPSQLRDLDPPAFEPKLISIGPLHRGKTEFLPMEQVKLDNLFYLHGKDLRKELRVYFDSIHPCLKRARLEYSENFDLSDEEFKEMLVLDGLFIVGYLLWHAYPAIAENTLIHRVKWGFDYLARDLLLLENQIPFYVVIALFQAVIKVLSDVSPDYQDLDLLHLALKFLDIHLPKENYPNMDDVRHLLHLQHLAQDPLRLCDVRRLPTYLDLHLIIPKTLCSLIYAPSIGLLYLVLFCDCYGLVGASKKLQDPRVTPSATELHEAGVTFQKKDMEPNERASQLKICFKDGSLEIPSFMVTHSTCCKLRNLIAFEQCCASLPPYFTSYCTFLDDIINTADDVAILRRSGILKSRLGSDPEVAEMFNGLCREVYIDYETHYNAQLCRDVGRFYEMPHNRWRANLVQKYFSSPWTIISVIAGIVLIVFTITQTMVTIYPRKQG